MTPKQHLTAHLRTAHLRLAPLRFSLRQLRTWHERWHQLHGLSHAESLVPPR